MDARQQLLVLAHGYAAARGISLARVSTLVQNQGAFFKKIEAGEAGFTFATFDKCLRWFAANWPEGTAWPADIVRPEERGPELASALAAG